MPHSLSPSHPPPLLLPLLFLLSLSSLLPLPLPLPLLLDATKLPDDHFDPSAPPKNPNPPPPHVVKERNERRFPGEWLPEGYDVGEAATSGTASSHTLWMSPLGHRAAHEPRIWYESLSPSAPRPPGRLLLNMLVMNEAENLRRTLPHWAGVVDYWIIGVDEKNNDDSIEVIKREMGHLPGEIALVKGFDGHGPTWTTLVDLGIKHFPGATHGIIADADFRPMRSTLNRMELDIRCSKHMFTIWSDGHTNSRRMDWIYRNIPGARITRRTHQVVEVPPLPDQEVFQTLVDLHLDERPGGWGDRSGNKQERYISWMAADLLDYPDDPRSLYYLAYGHLDLFNMHGGRPEQKHWDALQQAVHYFTRRVNLPAGVGNKEERWFAMLKLAEIHERFLGKWAEAEGYYQRCIDMDGERADPFFYIGQHYRLAGQPLRAEPFLSTAASLHTPERSLFVWHQLYQCIAKLEYARNWKALPKHNIKNTKKAKKILAMADCSAAEQKEKEERDRLKEEVEQKLQQLRKAKQERKEREQQQQEQQQQPQQPPPPTAQKTAEEAPVTPSREHAKKLAAEAASLKVARKKATAPSPRSSMKGTPASDSASTPRSPPSPSPPSSFPRPLLPELLLSPSDFVAQDDKVVRVRRLLRMSLQRADELERWIREKGEAQKQDEEGEEEDSHREEDAPIEVEAAVSLHESLVSSLQPLSTYLEAYSALPRRASPTKRIRRQADFLTCDRFLAATQPVLDFFRQKREQLQRLWEWQEEEAAFALWHRRGEELHKPCQ